MDNTLNRVTRHSPGRQLSARALVPLAAGLWLALLSGCAAVGNPVANGVPVRRLPPELLGESRETMETIPLTLLRQKPPTVYRLAPGDLLGVWIEGVLGEAGQPPAVRPAESGSLPPAPITSIPVQEDGTIILPFIDALPVQGMSLPEVREALRKVYVVEKKIIKPGRERILVTLQRPRQYHILVIRQDSSGGGDGTSGGRQSGFLVGVTGTGRGTRRGTGFAIDLPAYENDLLNALARTGGFPGTDAVNEVVIERGSFAGELERAELIKSFQVCPPGRNPLAVVGGGRPITRIPLRVRPGDIPPIKPEDIVLQNGDIVFIEAREADLFYTGGLLPAGEYVLPRDVDLDVLEAISRIGGTIDSGGVNPTNISGTFLTSGFGFPSPSLVTIIRRTPNGGQVPIRVDLNQALRDPRVRILIQPRDLILLQERPEEALARYLSQALHLDVLYRFVNNSHAVGVGTANVP